MRSLTSSPPTLEELFLRHYGEDIATPDAVVGPEVCAMNAFAGTGSLTWLALRRDRFKLPS